MLIPTNSPAQRNVLALLASAGIATALPSIIAPAPQPFGQADERYLRLDELQSIKRNCEGIQAALRRCAYVDPGTVHLVAEHLVGLHRQLAEGRTKLTRSARGVTTVRGLMHLLEETYDLLEPLAA